MSARIVEAASPSGGRARSVSTASRSGGRGCGVGTASRSGGRAWVLAIALVLQGIVGCTSRAPSATPEGAVREFVERMRRVQGDPGDAKAAFELLSHNTQANLKARAERYSAASGKPMAPEAMIVPSLFLLRFEPQRYHAQISGTRALVEAQGLLPDERAQIGCVYEDERWRLDLPVPPLSQIQMRPRDNE